MNEKEIEKIIEKWRKKVSSLKDKMEVLCEELNVDSSWPYMADEEDTPFETILSEPRLIEYKYTKIHNENELLKSLGNYWENERECIPWEWVELIIRDVVKSIEKPK